MATYQGHNEDSSGNLLLNIGNGMTATVELTNKASQAYTKGAYLFFNNRFCKASAAIASGATLAIGTNLTETSIGAELTSHLRSSDGKEFYFDVYNGKYGYYPSSAKTASTFVPFGGSPVFVDTIWWVNGSISFPSGKSWSSYANKYFVCWTPNHTSITLNGSTISPVSSKSITGGGMTITANAFFFKIPSSVSSFSFNNNTQAYPCIFEV